MGIVKYREHNSRLRLFLDERASQNPELCEVCVGELRLGRKLQERQGDPRDNLHLGLQPQPCEEHGSEKASEDHSSLG
jgi:hypothetical protein